MKLIYIFLLLFISSKSFGQDIIDLDHVYFENNQAYNLLNHQLLTGIVQDKKKNGHVKYEFFYEKGRFVKSYEYYNTKAGQHIYSEKIYDPSTSKIVKEIRYRLSDKESYSILLYDEFQQIMTHDYYKNEKIIRHESFQNRKKHGKWFCTLEDGSICETEYLNNKKIKGCTI